MKIKEEITRNRLGLQSVSERLGKLEAKYIRLEKAHSDLIKGKADSLMALVREYLVPGIYRVIHEKVREQLADYDAPKHERDMDLMEGRIVSLESHNERIAKIIGEKFFEDLFKEKE